MDLLLTIDVGNTNTVLGLHEGAALLRHWRLTTRREQTVDEYGVLVRNLFTAAELDLARIGGIALASVVPPLTSVVVGLCRQYLGHEPLVVEPGVSTGMPILYEPPGDVGADRIVNGVAAFASHGGTGSASAHNPRFACLAAASARDRTCSSGAYLRNHQTPVLTTTASIAC